MKFLIASGHEGTTGAVSGKYVEEVMTEQLAHKIVDELIAQGHEAIEPDFNLYDEVSKKAFRSMAKQYDYVVDLHFNWHSGSGHGTEVFVAKGRKDDLKVEKELMKALSKYFTSRGVKLGDFRTPRELNSLGVKSSLLEVAFLTSKSDMDTYFKNIDDIAKGIAHAIIIGSGGKIKEEQKLDDAQKWAVENGLVKDEDWSGPISKHTMVWILFSFFKRVLKL